MTMNPPFRSDYKHSNQHWQGQQLLGGIESKWLRSSEVASGKVKQDGKLNWKSC